MFTFSAVVVLPSDCILSFLFPAETDVLVPLLSRSIDVVVVNFVVVLKFPTTTISKTISKNQDSNIQVAVDTLVNRATADNF